MKKENCFFVIFVDNFGMKYDNVYIINSNYIYVNILSKKIDANLEITGIDKFSHKHDLHVGSDGS